MADVSLPEISTKLNKRFWEKVAKGSPEICWPWMGSRDRRGYGRLGNWKDGRTIPVLATHVSLLLDGRPRPSRHLALHSCDNPSCVNPNHLRWGTHTENTADRIARGRSVPAEHHSETMKRKAARGESHCCAKLSDEQVRAIKKDTRLHRQIAADYGISRSYVGQLKDSSRRQGVE